MSKLQLSVAVGNYDRVRPLIDGAVQIDGVDPVFMNLPPEEIFFRAFRSMDFDICELSMSSFTVKTAERNCPYVGVPAFVSRAFRHNSIYVRKDRIKSPADLKGKRVGLPEYQLTACVWARIILEDDHGVKPSDMIWVRGGIEHAGRPEKITIKLPGGVHMEDAAAGTTISDLLERGDIDGFIAPRPPSLAGKHNPNIGWLFDDPIANLAGLILPAVAVGYRYSAVSMRMTRSTVLEVLREDYVRTARAKGLRETIVVVRHALRNALLPVVTVVSLEFAFLIGGLVVTEQVFNLNGIGKLLVDAVAHRDYPLIQALVLLLAAVFVLVNFVVDMVYVVLDPRIRYS